MIRSNLCRYNDAYMHVKETVTILDATAAAAAANNVIKKVIFKNCTQFTNCISKINNKQLDVAHDTDVVMSMSNLIEYSHIYLKTSGSLWQYSRDELALDNNKNIINFPANNHNNNNILFKFK